MAFDSERPSIILATPTGSNGQLPAVLDPMLNGMEEEQIPFQILDMEGSSAVERAYNASVASRLSVGVAFDDTQIIVHYKNLAPDKPLFDVQITDPVTVRKVGANAARLVKGVPFKK
ncbi:propanediol dehydratase [Secundilactobacillus paracollinoides]|uniref:Propanediol dehydratase n=1 Tax=Secundilactobacillus paracollinoides TaxID=240427 RepID=A0A1B2IYI7_9LACO|nr:glycerol dehydratase reactivase beta/small subunit family protein [Secundilactobacillus paracollinoides]ANZ61190.1 propanediol dehydratase [Secundilactobacillus paracollinoides]ANZ64416.1 propanediol dehydratase [Secundilactobacillus paracollinoides]ANZ67112.1 propanediol dehydratase [Secundilactobacillus paracollinoides]KRL76112.1 pduh protein [Secundilactobacillus paracollinoides DSM 15502 = JCM 11969]